MNELYFWGCIVNLARAHTNVMLTRCQNNRPRAGLFLRHLHGTLWLLDSSGPDGGLTTMHAESLQHRGGLAV
ncbi:hypothetical protein C8T65DRAFT_671483 [Cerioporus squamosus]|nr:hypothetical protein C8T65DRAFT_671483 [Cerioporus squamosus]